MLPNTSSLSYRGQITTPTVGYLQINIRIVAELPSALSTSNQKMDGDRHVTGDTNLRVASVRQCCGFHGHSKRNEKCDSGPAGCKVGVTHQSTKSNYSLGRVSLRPFVTHSAPLCAFSAPDNRHGDHGQFSLSDRVLHTPHPCTELHLCVGTKRAVERMPFRPGLAAVGTGSKKKTGDS